MAMPVSVIGAGAWGTALAQVNAECGRPTLLWAREPDLADSLRRTQVNPIYLPGMPLSPQIQATAELTEAARHAEGGVVVLAVPAQHLRAVAGALGPHLKPSTPVVICAKGVEIGTGKLMTEVLRETAPQAIAAVLSGPTFAGEVARGLPTAATLACRFQPLDRQLVAALSARHFRLYLTSDLVGVQVGGAVKNVLAIACGIVVGRGLGENARAALLARGLAEILRYARVKGARPETLMGLSGIGDLALTCNSAQSRNTSLGIALGEGRPLAAILGERHSVAEGVATARALNAEAARLNIEMPICGAVNAVLHHGADIGATIEGLLARPLGEEF